MLGLWSRNASSYLLILSIATTLFFALPIFLAPLRWARLMLWKIPGESNLAVYFGRCLGAFILVLEFFMLRAALTGSGLSYAFDFLIGVVSLMLVLHIHGAILRIQPITETIEIGLWAILLACGVLFYPVASA